MRLLIVTQTVDKGDHYLGFFNAWIEELSKHFDALEVVCLYEGAHSLPPNVRVHSLGKERGKVPRAMYAIRFLRLAWSLRREYDAVFVHMNHEYLLVAGWLWFLLRKNAYLWYNHYAGSWLTLAATLWCREVFCSNKHSYPARYIRVVFMPVGVDTRHYTPREGIARRPRSVLFFARLSPSKRPHMLMEALGTLHAKGVEFVASFYGTPLPKDEPYLAQLKERCARLGLGGQVEFYPGQPPQMGPAIFSAHQVFVNLGKSGMYDKMIFEAAACGCVVLAMSDDWRDLAGRQYHFKDATELEDKLRALLDAPSVSMRPLAQLNSLQTLALKLRDNIT